MNNIFKTRWFKFILRTLIDWIVLILIFIIIAIVRSYVEPIDIYYDPEHMRRQKLEEYMEITEIRTYVDKKYNVKLFYPAFFVADTTGAGTAFFYYRLHYYDVSLKLSADTNIVNRDVEKAVDHLISNSDFSITCLDKGKDFYLVKGRVGYSGSFLRKCFLIDNNWIEYTLSYKEDYEEIIGKLISMMKEWEPRPSN